MLRLLYIYIVVALFSCQDREINYSFQYNFEQADGWHDISLMKGAAHSGQYAESINAEKEYGLTFNKKWAEIDIQEPVKTVNASVWIFAPDITAPAYLVLQITDPADGSNVEYISKNIMDLPSLKDRWTEVSFSYKVTGVMNGNFICKIYIWNPNKQQIFADDYRIDFGK